MARNKHPEETVEKILAVSAKLFMEKGYEHTTLQDIIDNLGGLTKGAIYHHFKGKEEILLAIADRMGEQTEAWMRTVRDDPGLTGAEKLQKMFRVVPGDVLKLDLTAIAAEKFQGLTPIVCANLPYNVTSPILEKLVESPCFTAFTVMIQREVAQRLCAPQGSSEGGSFSLFLQYYMKPELLFDVPPEKFLPAPKVTSAVIRCVRRERPAVDVADEGFFFKVMRGGFLLRRKTLANSLSAALPGIPKESIQQAITDMGLPAAVRGEQLTLEDFAALSAALGREADGD